MSQPEYPSLTAGLGVLIFVAARVASRQGQRPTNRPEAYRDRFGIEYGRMTRDQIQEAMRERRRRER